MSDQNWGGPDARLFHLKRRTNRGMAAVAWLIRQATAKTPKHRNCALHRWPEKLQMLMRPLVIEKAGRLWLPRLFKGGSPLGRISLDNAQHALLGELGIPASPLLWFASFATAAGGSKWTDLVQAVIRCSDVFRKSIKRSMGWCCLPHCSQATEKVKAAQSDADIASKEDAAAKDEDAASKDADVASNDVASKDADVASKDAAVASKDAAVAFKDADVVSKDADVAPKDDVAS